MRYIILFLIILLTLTLFMFRKKETNEGFQIQNGYTEACRELTLKRNFLKDYITNLRIPVQDLSANLIQAKQGKLENMKFQNLWSDKCASINLSLTNNSSFAVSCRALASVDKYELAVLPDIDIFFGTVLYANEAQLDYVLQLLNFYANLMKCQIDNSSRVTLDPSENIVTTDSNGNEWVVRQDSSGNHIDISRDIGDLDTPTLGLALEQLSPYYLSPDVVKFIIKFMISQETLDYLHTKSIDIVNQNHSLMETIKSLY